MTVGSGVFSSQRAKHPHLIRGSSGVPGEVGELRLDLIDEFSAMAGWTVEEFTNLPGTAAPGTAVLLAATATVASVVTLLPAGLLAAGLAMLPIWPRQLTFTTAGTTPSDAPANVVITGTDRNGAAQSETLNLAQTAATVTSVNYYKTITSIVYPAADGTGATVAIGIAAGVISPATATVVAPVTVQGSALNQSVLAYGPRQLVFTTAGTTASDAPANVVINGLDINGRVQTETLNLAQTATTATSSKYYAKITSLVYPAADGTGATIAVSIGAPVGLRRPIKTRAGYTNLLKEISGGSVVTNGTIVAAGSALPNGSYSPATAFNDSNDCCIYYEGNYAPLIPNDFPNL